MPTPISVLNWQDANFPIAVETGDCIVIYCGDSSPTDNSSNEYAPIVATPSGTLCYAFANADASITISDGIYNVAWVWLFRGAISISATFTLGTGNLISGALGDALVNWPMTASADWWLTFVSVQSGAGDPLILIVAFTDSSDEDNVIETLGDWAISAAPGFAYAIYPPPILSPNYAANDIISDICLRAGLTASQFDVNALTDITIFGGSTTVLGYVIGTQSTAAAILKPLMEAYFIDAVESSGVIRFIPRGHMPVVTVPESALGMVADKAKVKPEVLKQAQDLPLIMDVLFSDIALNYQQNRQSKMRTSNIVQTRNRATMNLPLVMTTTQAIQIAEAWLYETWLERSGYTFNLASPAWMQLDPTDVIGFVYEGETFQMRITALNIGQGFSVAISGVNNSFKNFISSLSGSQNTQLLAGNVASAPAGSSPITTTRIVGVTSLYLLDIPLLTDGDSNPTGSGMYAGMGSSTLGWPGAALLDSTDEIDYTQVAATTANLSFGAALNTLSAPATLWVIDNVSTLNINFVTGTLSGISLASFMAGGGTLIVGSEICSYQNATVNDDGSVTVSTLMRGLRGTEASCSTHAAGETVVVVGNGLLRIPETLGSIGILNYYEGVTAGTDPSTITPTQFTLEGNDLRPYAPVGVGGFVDGSGNITFTWARRTRIGGEADWNDGVAEVPLSEDSEAYQVDILNGSTVVRTLAVTSPTALYTAAMQTSDFGSPQSSVNANVYQMSAQVGRGNPGTGSAPSTFAFPVAVSGSGGGGFYVNGG